MALLLLGIASLFLDIYAALPALIWARWLGPFDKAGRIGYGLCWFSITAWVAVVLFYSDARGTNWFLAFAKGGYGLYLISVLAWFVIKSKFVERPARSVMRALLTAICGTLLLCPIPIWTGSFVAPLLLALFAMKDLPLRWPGGEVFPFWGAILQMIFMVMLAFLVAYWPARQRVAAPLAEERPEESKGQQQGEAR